METIAAYAREMRDFLVESELTERRAFIESFVKEIVVTPDDALMRYTVPMPDDSLIPGGVTEKVALDGAVLPTVKNGGPGWTRTNDLGLIRGFVENQPNSGRFRYKMPGALPPFFR